MYIYVKFLRNYLHVLLYYVEVELFSLILKGLHP